MGRPLKFDPARRGQLCAMVRVGCSLRNAARFAGVNIASVYYACRTDQAFAAQLRAAQQERDANALPWINDPWRATAAVSRQKNPDPWKSLGRHRFKQLVADVLEELLPQCLEAHARRPMIDTACHRIDERLAQIEAEKASGANNHASADDDFADEPSCPSQAPSTGADRTCEHSGDGPLSPDCPDEDPAVEAAAQAAYQRLLNLLNP